MKTQEFAYRNIISHKSETQFNLWMEILYVIVKTHGI